MDNPLFKKKSLENWCLSIIAHEDKEGATLIDLQTKIKEGRWSEKEERAWRSNPPYVMLTVISDMSCFFSCEKAGYQSWKYFVQKMVLLQREKLKFFFSKIELLCYL